MEKVDTKCGNLNRQEAMQEIREYIEIFYNLQRKQARLDYLSLAAFERQFYKKQEAA